MCLTSSVKATGQSIPPGTGSTWTVVIPLGLGRETIGAHLTKVTDSFKPKKTYCCFLRMAKIFISPGWQLIYGTSPRKSYLSLNDSNPEFANNILGGEVTIKIYKILFLKSKKVQKNTKETYTFKNAAMF